MMNRRAAVLVRAAAAAVIAGVCCAAFAQSAAYPAKPVRLIAPFAPGGASDVLTRLVAAQLTQDTGRNFIVENRAGAGGNIGMEALAKAAPDGYTLGIMGASIALNPALYPSLPFDPARDFAPIHMLVRAPHVLIVNKAIPAASLSELIAYIRSNPGKISYGSPGSGTTGHLYGELFKKNAGVDMTHVPYKSGNQVRQDIIAGTLQLAFSTLVDAQNQVQSGALKGIAMIASHRAPGLPEIATFAELGMPGFDSENWFGVFSPARVPPEIIGFLNRRIAAIVSNAEFKSRLAPTGLQPATAHSSEEFAQFIATDSKNWRETVRQLGIRAD